MICQNVRYWSKFIKNAYPIMTRPGRGDPRDGDFFFNRYVPSKYVCMDIALLQGVTLDPLLNFDTEQDRVYLAIPALIPVTCQNALNLVAWRAHA